MLAIVLLVLFVMVMFLWLLTLLGQVPGASNYHPWLSFFAVLFLGVVVFLTGTGVIVWR
jgi:hypothetical protein